MQDMNGPLGFTVLETMLFELFMELLGEEFST
jgi:hypothetical protein